MNIQTRLNRYNKTVTALCYAKTITISDVFKESMFDEIIPDTTRRGPNDDSIIVDIDGYTNKKDIIDDITQRYGSFDIDAYIFNGNIDVLFAI